MHLNEAEFFKRAKDMHVFSLTSRKIHTDNVKNFIDDIREINKRDPEFIYTCQKNGIRAYIWIFAYSDETVYKLAYTRGLQYFDEDNTNDSTILYSAECACPFI